MNKIILMITVSLALIGCTSGNNNHSDEAKPTPVSPQEKIQIQAVKEVVDSVSKLPGGDLIWKEKNESQSTIDSRNERISELDSDGKNFLAKIIENCEVKNPVLIQSPDNITPTDGAVLTQTKAAKIDGGKCPVAYDSNDETIITYSKVDTNAGVFAGNIKQSSSINQKVIAEDVSVTTNVLSIETKSLINAGFESASNINKSFGDGNTVSKLTTKNNGLVEINVISKYSVTTKSEIKQGEMSIIYTFKMENSEVVLTAKLEQNGEEKKVSYTLNGRAISKEELKETLGLAPTLQF